MIEKIICADALSGLAQLESGSVNMCVTSPPYFGLRDYGTGMWIGGNSDCEHVVSEIRTGQGLANSSASTRGGGQKAKEIDKICARNKCPKCGATREDKQIGLEETPEQYVQRLVEVFREVWRVLRDDGTLWINIGDSYSGSSKGGANYPDNAAKYKQGTNRGSVALPLPSHMPDNCKPKDLIGIPWMLAFALRADGWYLRQDIIWQKPNAMPESVKDRCTKSHEYIFLLSKSNRYYFNADAIREPAVGFNYDLPAGSKGAVGPPQSRRRKGNARTFRGGGVYTASRSFDNSADVQRESHGNAENESGLRNKRDVWTIATQPYKGAHFATFPPELIRPCILAGSRKGDIVLDPFFGSGTTGLVAMEEQRGYIGIELKSEYILLSRNRLDSAAIQYKMWA